MKVVVYEPDYNPKHRIVLRALAEGIPGAIVRPVTKYEPCDVAVVFGGVKKAFRPTWSKAPILERHQGRSLIMVESAFVRRGEYWAVGWGGTAGHADFNTDRPLPMDRVAQIGVPGKPWSHRNGPVVVCGQLPRDVQVQDVDHPAWCRQTVETLHKAGHTVWFRPHPKIDSPYDYGVPTEFHNSDSLADVLRVARAVVTWNSTTAVESVIWGVPTVALDRGSMAWPVTGHALHDLDCRPVMARKVWLAGLGYSQWTLDEMREGQPWRHLTAE